jgi:O-acetylhomoserine/O-acetylserine sulfhydrylase-like pyridoxal-dependent enzyme
MKQKPKQISDFFMKFNTKAIHAGQEPEETSGAVMPPIFQTSTYAQQVLAVFKRY